MAVVKGFRLGEAQGIRSPKVVITMPAYNAEATLARTIADIPVGIADQLIVVDDASPDNTAQLARDLGVDVYVHPHNRGYGGNQKTCYTMALRDDADIVVMLHPDYQYEPKAVPLLIAPLLAGDAEMTFGSRFAGLGDPRGGGMPIYRYVGNRTTTILENLLLGSRFTEMHSGMRAYTRKCLLSLPFLRYSDDFVFDSQLLIDAVTRGQRVAEVPIPTRYTDESSSIGTMQSLAYVARSIGYCARTVAAHGRRAHRSPIGWRDATPAIAPSGYPAHERLCALCGVPRLHRERSRNGFLECTSCGVESPRQAARAVDGALSGRPTNDVGSGFLEWCLRKMSGYVVRGKSLLPVGISGPRLAELAHAAGWQVVAPRVHDDEGFAHVDAAMIVTIGADLVGLGGLVGLRASIDAEGLLVLVIPAHRERSVRPRRLRSPSGGSSSYSLRPETLESGLREAGFRLVEWTHVPREPARDFERSLLAGSTDPVASRLAGDVRFVVARPDSIAAR